VKVKICGVNSGAAADAAAEAGADWIGLVFAPLSPRYVNPAQAAELANRVRGGPGRVGLFVEPDDDLLLRVLETVELEAVQLYANAERCRAVAAIIRTPVWRSIAVASREELPGDTEAAALLIEPRAGASSLLPGGNGRPLDWRLLRGWKAPAPWLLAGGLTPANVRRAIAESGAMAVDVSSGVESERGVKSPALIAAFVRAARIDPAGALV
jgi:phosphoribosylanthranilate isomerase